jgi:hypothetical protein
MRIGDEQIQGAADIADFAGVAGVDIGDPCHR